MCYWKECQDLPRPYSPSQSRKVSISRLSEFSLLPDLLPADLIGTVIFNPKTANFETRKGPIFTEFFWQMKYKPCSRKGSVCNSYSAWRERLVTIGDTTFHLDAPFMVLATENPIDQEGTYQLPEAQMDRFLMKVNVDYPREAEEIAILSQHGSVSSKNKEIKKALKSKRNPRNFISLIRFT